MISLSRHRQYSEELAQRIDTEISNTLRSAYERAKEIISSHRAPFDKLVSVLLEKEVVEAKEIDEILGLKPAEPVKEQSAQVSADELSEEATAQKAAVPASGEKPKATQGDLFE